MTQWEILGQYFGYPDCCIAEFHERGAALFAGTPWERQPVLDGTGYVPCTLCAATYTDEELIARIEERRLCPEPFPKGDDEMARILHAREEAYG